jgi:hypothetical protein
MHALLACMRVYLTKHLVLLLLLHYTNCLISLLTLADQTKVTYNTQIWTSLQSVTALKHLNAFAALTTTQQC